MADCEYRLAELAEPSQYRRELALEFGVKSFGRLVEQEYVRLGQQQLRERGALRLAAGQVVRMPVEQSFESA